jgi:hypothetical protein
MAERDAHPAKEPFDASKPGAFAVVRRAFLTRLSVEPN